MQLVISEARGPLLHESFKHKDLYLSIVEKLVLENFKLLKDIPIKDVRKLVKFKPLSMLNGGSINTLSHITLMVDRIFLPESDENKFFLKAMTNVLAKQAIVREYKKHGDYLVHKKHFFTLTHTAKVSCTKKQHILSSPLMCAAEPYFMTLLLEFLGDHEIRFLPLLTIHDGFTLSTKTKLSYQAIFEIAPNRLKRRLEVTRKIYDFSCQGQ